MEVKQNIVKDQLDIIYRPHPILPAADCQYYAQEWRQGMTVRQILIANGIDQYQPISIILDDRLLTVQEWDTVCPNPGQIINVKAEVEGGGGGGGSNPMQVVAMVALVVVAAILAAPTGGASLWLAGATGLSATTAGMIIGGIVMIAGSLIINAVFATQQPAVDLGNTSGSSSQTSPTYSISGGQNRQRLYESMPVIMGYNKIYFDLASKPFTQYYGDDQFLYQVFNRGLSSATYSNYKIGDNALTNYSDYVLNFADSNGFFQGFPGNVDSAPGAVLENSSGWVTRTTSVDTYRIGLDIEGTLFYANDSGGMDSTSVQLRVQYRAVGSGTWIDPSDIEISGNGFVDGHYENYSALVSQGYDNYDGDGNWLGWVDTSYYETRTRFVSGGATIIVSGNSQAPRRASLFINTPSIGQYEVRIIRDTADSTDSRLSNRTNWSTIRSYQLDNGYYRGQDRFNLIIRASEQLNGVVQQLSATASARANYWNGSAFVFSETSNPAHWFMDFAIGHRNQDGKLMYGVGLTQSQVDYASLHAWAQFCTTEGLTFNAVIDGSQTAADILSAIARCGFASPTWASGKLGVIWDQRDATPVAAFGMSNIIKGSFNVTYITENLAEEIIVKYIDPDKDWDQNEVRVNVPNVTNPQRSSTVDLFGCTSKTMAGKFANYIAAQQYYRRRRITWDCDFEGFVCNRGDVVLLSHDLTQWGYSGRVVSYTSAQAETNWELQDYYWETSNADWNGGISITLDREIPRNGTAEYLMLKLPDGTMTTYTAIPSSIQSNVISFNVAPGFDENYLPIDHIWFFSPLSTPGKKVKILSVQPVSESRVQIVATDEYSEFYDAWDGPFNEPGQSTLLLNSSVVISNINVTETLYRGNDNAIKSHVGITWQATGSFDRFNIRYRVNNGIWKSLTSQSTSVEFDTTDHGKIEIEIVSISGVNVGNKATANNWLYGITRDVPNVASLLDFYRDGNTVITWPFVTDPRSIEYEIRKGTTWDKAQVLGRIINNEFSTDGDGTYWVAAHTGTLYSPTPISIVIQGSSLVSNVIVTYDEEATGWSGTLSGGAAISGTDIILSGTPIPSSGSYEIPAGHIVDIGTSQPCTISCSYKMTADSPFNLVSLIPVFSEITSLVGKYAGMADVKIQIAIAPDSGVFGSWRDFVPGTYIGRKFKLRAMLYSYDTTVTPVLDSLAFTVDMPDRVERGTNVSCTAGGISVTYAKPFQIKPNVQVTVINAVANDDIVISSETASGFNVKIINGATNVTRTINWIAQAY